MTFDDMLIVPRRFQHVRPLAAIPDTHDDVATSPEEAKSWLTSQESRESWEACAAQLEDLGLAPEACDKLLAKGFAWTSRAYWGLDKVKSRQSVICQPMPGINFN
jgi:hypothetical protein